MRVLLVEDDTATANSIEAMLSAEGFICDLADLGEDGIEIGKLYDYDIVVLDLMLPDIDGFEVLRRLRAAKVETPVLILSGLDTIADKIKGLGIGADDYLTKPFARDELLARIRAVVRRAQGRADPLVQVGRLTINLGERLAEVDEMRVPLTGKEFSVLELLAMRQGKTLTKESILNHLYGGIDEPELKIVDVFICKLRKKLARATGGKSYIETVWGRGYVLRAADETPLAKPARDASHAA